MKSHREEMRWKGNGKDERSKCGLNEPRCQGQGQGNQNEIKIIIIKKNMEVTCAVVKGSGPDHPRSEWSGER
jgi:hypothetical protein